MKRGTFVLAIVGTLLGACSAKKQNAGSGGDGGNANAGGGTAATGGANLAGSGNGGSGNSGGATEGTCMDILTCIGGCPDGDTSCPDACYAGGSATAQNQMLALLQCMDQAQCTDVSCIESQCANELTTCLDSSTAGGGTPNPGGNLPPGSIPPELVGHWVSPGSTDVSDFTFGADGSAQHSNYKESSLGSCDMKVLSQWTTGTVVASGAQLTVTLADGVTSVDWQGGCGTSYTNPAGGQVLSYQYAYDNSQSVPGIWLTDQSCSGQYCEVYYHKD